MSFQLIGLCGKIDIEVNLLYKLVKYFSLFFFIIGLIIDLKFVSMNMTIFHVM